MMDLGPPDTSATVEDLLGPSRGLSVPCGFSPVPSPAVKWRWVSPLLSAGTPEHARQLGDVYCDDAHQVALGMRHGRLAYVVPTVEVAADVLRLLGYDEAWITVHVLSDRSFSGTDSPSVR